ncbi:MAG: DUF4240 domain-containing protein [Oscillospiraceae bacterium]|jgi:hypothetical protein|nr:DUF4240 domain-containing protein [Oscillospiraceae bacterium]
MKKSVKKLLTEECFWELIENSCCGERLRAELEDLTEGEILGFIYWWNYYIEETYRQELWAVASVVLQGCSDDGFEYFRRWLLTRGKSAVLSALADPDSLCDEFDKLPDKVLPEWEKVGYIAYDVYGEKSGKDVFTEMKKYDFDEGVSYREIELEWSWKDPDTIRRICPRTFKKWRDSDKFDIWGVCWLSADPDYFTGREPVAVLFDRERVEASTWKKVFAEVLRRCSLTHRDALLSLRGRIKDEAGKLLSDSPGGMKRPVRIDDALYAESGNYGAADLIRVLCERILDRTEFFYQDIKVVLKTK